MTSRPRFDLPAVEPMDFEALVRPRHSVRGYKPEPVPRHLIEEIINLAKSAPASMNTQPWHIHVLTATPLDKVRRRNTELMLAGAKPQRDIMSHRDLAPRQGPPARFSNARLSSARCPVSLVLTYDKAFHSGTIAHCHLLSERRLLRRFRQVASRAKRTLRARCRLYGPAS